MSVPTPYELYKQTGGGDAYRVAMLEHGHIAPADPRRLRPPGKRVMQCGLTHEQNWSEWRTYGNDTEGFYEGRWCRTCAHPQFRCAMTDVPDPQPPAPEASVEALVETVREALHLLGPDDEDAGTKHEGQLNGYAALDALLAEIERLEGERDDHLSDFESEQRRCAMLESERDEAYRQAAQADEAHMLTGKRCRDALEALRQASDCCSRPPGVCFDPNLADGGQENPRALLGSGEEQEPGA